MSPLITLIVYAYSSIAAPWGAGPIIATEFEKTCLCKIKLIDTGDGRDVVNRLKLEGDKTPADILWGLDQGSLDLLKTKLGWKNTAIAFDYGPYAFIYNSKTLKDPPQSLDDLLDEKWKGSLILEDPRLSATGLGFLLWVLQQKGEPQAWNYFKKLKAQVKITAPSWDLAYGLFKKGQGQMVFSYWTSPAYHIQEENNHDFKAIAFRGGNYIQKEFVMATPISKNEEIKKKFLKFIVSEFAQKEMAKHNFMYPIIKSTPLTEPFHEIGTVKELPELFPNPEKLEEWLRKWREIFS